MHGKNTLCARWSSASEWLEGAAALRRPAPPLWVPLGQCGNVGWSASACEIREGLVKDTCQKKTSCRWVEHCDLLDLDSLFMRSSLAAAPSPKTPRLKTSLTWKHADVVQRPMDRGCQLIIVVCKHWICSIGLKHALHGNNHPHWNDFEHAFYEFLKLLQSNVL